MTLGRISFGPLVHQTLGFENFIREVEKMVSEETKPSGFPHHNIIKVDDNRYIVELAVAGFSKDEIEITRQDGSLKIVGVKQQEDMGQATYLHRGIATRSFTKTITIADTVEVHSSEIKDGILRIGLINIIPEHKKPKRIEIGSELKFFEPTLLQEDKKQAKAA
jgi:molecular chaperone IbpA